MYVQLVLSKVGGACDEGVHVMKVICNLLVQPHEHTCKQPDLKAIWNS